MINLDKPLFQASIRDLVEALTIALKDVELGCDGKAKAAPKKHLVYGIAGLADLLKCSTATAQRIKSSGVLDDCISQIGGVIVIDSEMALDTLKVSKKYRSNLKKRLEK